MRTRVARIIACGTLLLLAACAANQSFVEETRTAKSIQAAFDISKHDIYRVHLEALKRQPELRGKTFFRITVSAEGNVVQSTVLRTSLNDLTVPDAVNEVIRGMSFGRVRQSENFTFIYPIEFTSSSRLSPNEEKQFLIENTSRDLAAAAARIPPRSSSEAPEVTARRERLKIKQEQFALLVKRIAQAEAAQALNPQREESAPQVKSTSAASSPVDNQPPRYPETSRRLGEEGVVIVVVLVSSEGRPDQVELRTSSGYPRLDEAALKSASEWTYSPGKKNGNPIPMWMSVPFHFSLGTETDPVAHAVGALRRFNSRSFELENLVGNASFKNQPTNPTKAIPYPQRIVLSEEMLQQNQDAGTAKRETGSPLTYAEKIRASIPPVIYSGQLTGNPVAVMEITTNDEGVIVGRLLVKPSGDAAWDHAVYQAVYKADFIPPDVHGRVPHKLEISFSPRSR